MLSTEERVALARRELERHGTVSGRTLVAGYLGQLEALRQRPAGSPRPPPLQIEGSAVLRAARQRHELVLRSRAGGDAQPSQPDRRNQFHDRLRVARRHVARYGGRRQLSDVSAWRLDQAGCRLVGGTLRHQCAWDRFHRASPGSCPWRRALLSTLRRSHLRRLTGLYARWILGGYAGCFVGLQIAAGTHPGACGHGGDADRERPVSRATSRTTS